jgi:4-amino-4-deoxy-L-arabinose transferase-like glycosyltransferase
MLGSSNRHAAEAGLRTAAEWVHVGIMMLVATYLRFPGLGELSFYGDEEYSALAVQGILADGYPHMPSGMAYWRGAPYSFLAAGAALLFGLSEFSVRLPSVVFGVLTVPIFYALAKRHMAAVPAGIASWLLVFSAWHIDMSREGRMYAMFLAWFLLCLVCFERGFLAGQRRFRFLTVLCGCVTVMLHEIGALLILFWGIALVLQAERSKARKSVSVLLAVLGVFAYWYLYQRLQAFVYPGSAAAIEDGASIDLLRRLLHLNFTPKFWMVSDMLTNHVRWYLALAALAVAWVVWIWKTETRNGTPRVTFVASSAILFALAVMNLFGVIASAALAWMLIEGKRIVAWFRLKAAWMTLAGLTGILMFWGLYGVLIWQGRGLEVQSNVDLIKKVVKDCVYYPALHIVMYYEAFPRMTIAILIGTVLWIALYFQGRGSRQQEAPLFAWFWIPLLALGITREWTALRYTLPVYPFFVMIFAWTIFEVIVAARLALDGVPGLARLPRFAIPELPIAAFSACLVLAPAFNEEHGLHDALAMGRLSYDQKVSPLLHGFAFHPDHKGPGEFVRANMSAGDIVIAMDAFEQFYYVGKVDYWLRDETEAKPFSYLHGARRYDIYTKSAVMSDRDELTRLLTAKRGYRVWLITSGELPGAVYKFVSPSLLNHETAGDSRCVFVGRDHESHVYLFPPTA